MQLDVAAQHESAGQIVPRRHDDAAASLRRRRVYRALNRLRAEPAVRRSPELRNQHGQAFPFPSVISVFSLCKSFCKAPAPVAKQWDLQHLVGDATGIMPVAQAAASSPGYALARQRTPCYNIHTQVQYIRCCAGGQYVC